MILIGLGANLPSSQWGPPAATLEAALDAFGALGIELLVRSGFYETAPVPPSDQPRFVNAVAEVKTAMGPEAMLQALLGLEARFGRVRQAVGAARVLDLDLLAYGEILTPADAHPALPHPRLHERAFVLRPLAEIAPGWRHPRLGKTPEEMMAGLAGDQEVRLPERS
jgi:2-amino-4-hydroxy-6-hydroxymethyldihydropteridine diphosphokinase